MFEYIEVEKKEKEMGTYVWNFLNISNSPCQNCHYNYITPFLNPRLSQPQAFAMYTNLTQSPVDLLQELGKNACGRFFRNSSSNHLAHVQL
jgi:hypothetical protein